MRLRRIAAAFTAAAIIGTFGAGCTSDDGEFSASNPETGVTVHGPKRSLGGDIKVEKAASPPQMAASFGQVGAVTHVQGKLKGDVTVTLPVPADYKGSIDDLWIIKHDGTSWLPLPPQAIDTQKRTLSITTREFSFWTLATWQAEQAAAQLAADLRNLTSTDGAWVISDAAKFTGNAPVTECRYPALTLKLDARKFIKDAILCPKFVAQGKDAEGRTTYDLHISNIQTYPVKLYLNGDIVTFKQVAPPPNNPFHVAMQAVARSQQVVTLPGAGELVVTVRGDKIPQGGIKISGYLDFTTLMVDLVFAGIKGATGLNLQGEFIENLQLSHGFASFMACATAGSKKLAEEFQQGKQGTAKELAGKISKEAFGCIKGDLLVAVLKDYYRNHGVFMSDEDMAKWLATVPARIVNVLENAPVLISLASAIATVKFGGRTTYLLNIINNDPATKELYKALPTPGKGGFKVAPGEDTEPANGGQLTYVGTPCMAKAQAQSWETWSLAGAHAYYMREGIGTSIQVVYVRPEHKGAVHALFTGMASSTAKCELREDGNIVELEKFPGRQYGDLTDYRVGLTGWENSEYGHYGAVSAYDPIKGVVVHIWMFADPYADVELADIKAQLPAALDYTANKLDVSIGTSYALK